MFTSSAFAPLAHLLERDLDAASRSSASTSERKRAEPVTFVRSPIITKPVSGPISNGSSPLQRVAAGRAGTPRAERLDRPPRSGDVLGRRAAAAADDVHEPVLARTRAR
jgi:hypothetical protein